LVREKDIINIQIIVHPITRSLDIYFTEIVRLALEAPADPVPPKAENSSTVTCR